MKIESELRTFSIKSELHLQRYLKLINHFLENPCKENQEEHHILPRSMFPLRKKDKDNIVSLPRRWHYIAHYFLWKLYRNEAMTSAFQMMKRATDGTYTNSILYAKLKKDFIEKQTGKRWYFSKETGQHIFVSGDVDSKVWIKGYNFSTKHGTTYWHTNKMTGEVRRFGKYEIVSDEWTKGRGTFRGFNSINSKEKFLDIVEKRYVMLDSNPKKWNLLKGSLGQKLDELLIIEFNSELYFSLSAFKRCYNMLPDKFSLNEKTIDTFVKEPHHNMRKAVFDFCSKNKGKTYKEAGFRLHRFKDFIFDERMKLVI